MVEKAIVYNNGEVTTVFKNFAKNKDGEQVGKGSI